MGTFRNIVAGAMLIGALNGAEIEAQSTEPDSVSIELEDTASVEPPKPKNSFSIRVPYDLSAGSEEDNVVPRIEGTAHLGNGYIATGWVDFSNDTYFSKTAIVKPLDDYVVARALFGHANEPLTVIGAGPVVRIPGTPEYLTLKAGMGFWDRITEGPDLHSSVDLWVSATLPYGIELDAYAVWAQQTFEEEGKIWSFNDGEINLSRQFGDLELQVNTSLTRSENGILTPDVNSRIAIKYNF